MHQWMAYLFGRFRLERQGEEIEPPPSRKAQELLAYLLLNRPKLCNRDRLAQTLWPENPAALQVMRQSLWQLQQALGDDDFLEISADTVQINPAADLWIDVKQFEAIYESVDDVASHCLNNQQQQALRQAVQLYQHDLLEGWYQDWSLYEREYFQNMYLMLLDKLMDCCETNQEYEAGLGYGERVLHIDRAHEHTHQHLIRFYYLAGDRTAALRQYGRCAAALRDELGTLPSPQTEALANSIRAGRFNLSTPQTETASPHEMLSYLHDLKQRIIQLQNHIRGRTESN